MAYGCTYGQSYGTDSCAVGTFEQGYEANAKQDTTFLGKADSYDYAALANDRSGEATDFTDNSTYMSGGSSVLWTTEGGVEFVADISTAETNDTLFSSTGGASTLSLKVTEATGVWTLDATINGSVSAQITITSLLTGSDRRFAIGWFTRAYKDTTGAGDAYESILMIKRIGASGYAQHQWTHAVISSTGWTGCDVGNGWGNTIYQARFSRRWHTSTEMVEDFVERSATPSAAGVTRVEMLVPDRDSGFGAEGELAGPVHSIAAAGVWKHDLRMLSPILNEAYRNPVDFTDSYSPVDESLEWMWRTVTTDYNMGLMFLGGRPVPEIANRIKARVHVKTWMTSGTIVPLDVRFFTFNKLPTTTDLSLFRDISYEQRYATSTIEIDHVDAGTAGSWLDFTALQPMLDPFGYTYLALAFRINNGSSAANFRFNVNAFVVEPLSVSTPEGAVLGAP